MKTFLHVLTTWCLSIFITLLLVILWSGYEDGNFSSLWDPALLSVLLICFVAAIPSLFISWLFLVFILKIFDSNYARFFLWVFAAIISILMDIIIVLFVVDDFTLIGITMYPKILFIFWPPYLAAIIGILIRAKQFFSLNDKTHETGMV